MTDTLSKEQAQKIILLSQRLSPLKQSGTAISATLNAIEHLGYVQVDTISVVQRAHHHTLWNRNPRYKLSHLDQLLDAKKVFEYWSHAASYLPMRDYRYSLPRKQAIANDEQSHWYDRDERLMNSVLKRIADEGPLMAKDFEHTGVKKAGWQTKPAKRALENLYMQGQLMVLRRKQFHKVYDLTERVLPKSMDTRLPSKEEHTRFLITRYLQANGLGQASEISYLLKNTKATVSSALQDMYSNKELLKIAVKGSSYYALPHSMDLLSQSLGRSKLKILSPFDNLLIQRKRMKALFNFDYLIECYVPEKKRQYGYFCLPILWNGELVARMDCKVDRKQSVLNINHLSIEPHLQRSEAFSLALSKELVGFLAFNDCERSVLHKTTPGEFKTDFKAMIES